MCCHLYTEDDISGSDVDDNSDIDDKSDASEDDEDAVQLLQSGRHGNKEGAPRKKRKKEKRTIQKLAQIKREQVIGPYMLISIKYFVCKSVSK